MGADSGNPRLPKHTPIPTATLMDLTSAVVEIRTGVKSIKDDILPPVAKAAQEARDGVLDIRSWRKDVSRRMEAIEQKESPDPPCPKECKEEKRQDAQDSAIETVEKVAAQAVTTNAAQDARIDGHSKWRWWLMAAILAVGGTAIGLVLKNTATDTEQSVSISTNTKAIDRNEKAIKAVVDGQQDVVEALGRVETAVRNGGDPPPKIKGIVITDAARRKLRPYQKKQLNELLEQVGAPAYE